MIVVGIDPATHLGAAVLRDGRLTFSYAYDFSDYSDVDRLLRLERVVTGLFADHGDGAELVAVEGYSFARQGYGTFLAGEYGGVIRLCIGKTKAKMLVVSPQTLKKFGRGVRGTFNRAAGGSFTKRSSKSSDESKEEVRRGVVEMLPSAPKFRSYDESDAAALSLVGSAVLRFVRNRIPDPNPIRQEVVHALAKEIQGPFA